MFPGYIKDFVASIDLFYQQHRQDSSDELRTGPRPICQCLYIGFNHSATHARSPGRCHNGGVRFQNVASGNVVALSLDDASEARHASSYSESRPLKRKIPCSTNQRPRVCRTPIGQFNGEVK